MNQRKYLDSCIQKMQVILGDSTNELGPVQRKVLAERIRVLRRLTKRKRLGHEELYRVVGQIAEEVSGML